MVSYFTYSYMYAIIHAVFISFVHLGRCCYSGQCYYDHYFPLPWLLRNTVIHTTASVVIVVLIAYIAGAVMIRESQGPSLWLDPEPAKPGKERRLASKKSRLPIRCGVWGPGLGVCGL